MGLFRQLSPIYGADVGTNCLMTLEPMEAPRAAHTEPRSEAHVMPEMIGGFWHNRP